MTTFSWADATELVTMHRLSEDEAVRESERIMRFKGTQLLRMVKCEPPAVEWYAGEQDLSPEWEAELASVRFGAPAAYHSPVHPPSISSLDELVFGFAHKKALSVCLTVAHAAAKLMKTAGRVRMSYTVREQLETGVWRFAHFNAMDELFLKNRLGQLIKNIFGREEQCRANGTDPLHVAVLINRVMAQLDDPIVSSIGGGKVLVRISDIVQAHRNVFTHWVTQVCMAPGVSCLFRSDPFCAGIVTDIRRVLAGRVRSAMEVEELCTLSSQALMLCTPKRGFLDASLLLQNVLAACARQHGTEQTSMFVLDWASLRKVEQDQMSAMECIGMLKVRNFQPTNAAQLSSTSHLSRDAAARERVRRRMRVSRVSVC